MSYLDHNFVPADDSRSPRQRRLVRAHMTDSFGETSDIVIRNVSEKGLGASSQGTLPLRGSTVTITIPQGMTMTGEVRWIADKSFGVKFDEGLDLDKLTQIIQRKQESVNRQGHWEVRSLHQIDTGHIDPSKLRKV
jgi:hypothetical protein